MVGNPSPVSKILKLYLLIVLVGFVHAAENPWKDPPYEVVNDPPYTAEKLYLEKDDDAGTITVYIEEEVDNGDVEFPILLLHLEGSAEQLKVTLHDRDEGKNCFPKLVEKDGTSNWYLYASKKFDYEVQWESFDITMKVASEDGESLGDSLVYIQVLDINDNAPEIIGREPQRIDPIEELKEPSTEHIFRIIAEDKDVGDVLKYELFEDSGSETFFTIDQSGYVFQTKELDYSLQSSHRLVIKVSDDRPPIHTVEDIVIINVKDMPNLPPVFTRTPIIRPIDEETAIGTRLIQVQARDGDTQLNWDINYFLEDNYDLLEIERESGWIKVKSRIDAESDIFKDELSYSVTVTAKEVIDADECPDCMETTETIEVTIVDIDDQEPKLCNDVDDTVCDNDEMDFSFEIEENFGAGIPLDDDAIIRVIDLDPTTLFNTFTAKMVVGNGDDFLREAFTITPSEGSKDQIFTISANTNAIDFDDEDANWRDEEGNSKEIPFKIEFIGKNDNSHKATANVKAKVKDVNDNQPIFKPNGNNQYEFSVCENMVDGEQLYNIVPTIPNACKESRKDLPVEVYAKDKDISTDTFGQNSVIYQWSASGRSPPVAVGRKNGLMTMQVTETLPAFDYERLQEEFFVLEARDMNGEPGYLFDTAYVKFTILDVNDMNVELRVDSLKTSIDEETWYETVMDGITAKDVDVTANVEMTMRLSDSMRITDPTLRERVDSWFKLEVDGSGTGNVKASIIIADRSNLPDREGYGIMDVDRVDLTIEVEDKNSETGQRQISSQDVSIIIDDINDNEPQWPEGEDYSGAYLTVQETGETDDDTDSQREIQRFRIVDPDLGTRFIFRIENNNCVLPPEVCSDIKKIFELTKINDISGTATLSRIKDAKIDRENRTMFPDKTKESIIDLTFIASDGENELASEIFIIVTDINDNTPIFVEDYSMNSYVIDEDAVKGFLFEIIQATDEDHPDRYGKVSYLLESYKEAGDNDGWTKFAIGLDSGELKTNEFEYDWFIVSEYQLKIKAIDDYREGSDNALSRSTEVVIRIAINDKNNHDPAFLTEQGMIITEKETTVEKDNPFNAIIEIQDRDDPSKPNGEIYVGIETVEKVPRFNGDPDLESLFELQVSLPDEKNIKKIQIVPKTGFVGLWGTYTITLKATDGVGSEPEQRNSTAKYIVHIENENLNKPEFQFPPVNELLMFQLSIKDAEPNQQLVDIGINEPIQNVYATDKDKGSGPNGEIDYGFRKFEDAPEDCPQCVDCSELFRIGVEEGAENTTGKITLREKLVEEHSNKRCMLIITASDRGEVTNVGESRLVFYLVWYINTPPAFPALLTSITLKENQTVDIPEDEIKDYATDEDIEVENPYFPNDRIYYFFKGGESDAFNLRQEDRNVNSKTRQIPLISPKYPLDRETKDEYKFVLYATNKETADDIANVEPDKVGDLNNRQYIVVIVEVEDIIDFAPYFDVRDDTLTGGFSEISRIGDVIRMVDVLDPDLDDPVTIVRSSGFSGSDDSLPLDPDPFELEVGEQNNGSQTVKLILKFDPKPTFKGFIQFRLRATDSIGLTGDVNCKMYMITRKHIVIFSFNNTESFVNGKLNELGNIITEAFGDRCNIDRVIPVTREISNVETHFINLSNNEPISGTIVAEKRFDPLLLAGFVEQLRANDFIYNGIEGPSTGGSERDLKDVIMYGLIGGVAVLTVALLIVGATCFYNNRGLTRRVRALTASTFGSQKSDLNRIGMVSAPNTNTFAHEGSNPIWTVDSDSRKIPEFDTQSIGSGGSVLIGAEDEDYFQKSKFQDDDIVANYESGENYYNEPYYNHPKPTHGKGPAPLPPALEARQSKNPLMTLGSARKSVDVDAFNDDDDLASVLSDESYNNSHRKNNNADTAMNDNFLY